MSRRAYLFIFYSIIIIFSYYIMPTVANMFNKKTKRRWRRAKPYTKRTKKKVQRRRVLDTYTVNTKYGKHFFYSWESPIATSGGGGLAVTSGGNTGTTFKQDTTGDSWYINTGTLGNISYNSCSLMFRLGDLVGSSKWLANYDQYKINKCILKITPYNMFSQLQTGQSSGSANQNLGVIMHCCRDYDDNSPFAATVGGINAMRNRIDYKTYNLQQGKPIYLSVKPHIAVGAFGSAIFTNYANMRSIWIDSNSPSVEHYGLKWIFETFQTDSTDPMYIWMKLEVKYNFECKNPI